MKSRGKLQNKVLVVIGGTSGLGHSAVKAFLAEGACVIAVGRNPDAAAAAKKEFGRRASVFAGDATDPTIAPKAIAAAEKQFGGCHGLYHVAGGSGRRFGDGPLHELTDDGWRKTIDWNLASVAYSNRAALQYWLKQKLPGTILNMTSVLGFSPSPQFFSTHAYAAAKAAIIGLTRSAAAYYAFKNIRVNAIAPALVETPMSARAQRDRAILRFIRHKQPLEGGRIGRPEDLDAAAVYFMSDDSRYVTGQVLAVDGGWSVSDS